MAPVPSGYPVRVDAGPHLPGGQGRGAVRGFAVRLEGRRGFELRGFGLGAALGVGESFVLDSHATMKLQPANREAPHKFHFALARRCFLLASRVARSMRRSWKSCRVNWFVFA